MTSRWEWLWKQQPTSEGGENIGFLDPGDYLDYEINVTVEGAYSADYRTAALFGTGGLELQLIDAAGNVTVTANPSFSSTGDWQNWETTTETIELPKGEIYDENLNYPGALQFELG